ncbi:Cytochrome P450 [Naviculisporaceae sp. PSN 640]
MTLDLPNLIPSEWVRIARDLTLGQTLVLLTVVSIAYCVLDTFSTKTRQLQRIPSVGYGPIPIPIIQRWYGAINLMLKGRKLLFDGYIKHKGSIFRLSGLEGELVVVTEAEKFAEYVAAPDSVLSQMEPVNNLLAVRRTVGELSATSQMHAPLVRINLTQHISRWVGAIREEIAKSSEREIGNPQDWTEVAIADVIPVTIARLGNRVMFGEELGKNEKHVENCVGFTNDLIISAFSIRVFPSWFQDIAIRFTPILRRRKLVNKVAGPHVQARINAVARGEDVPDDMLTWLIQTYPPELRTVDAIIETMMFINFGSIHTTAGAFMAALYHIAGEPEKYIPALRQEFEQVLTEGSKEGSAELTKQMLGKLVKMDSVLLESARLDPPQMASVHRLALKPFTFKEGTTIPAGTTLCLAATPIQNDPEFFTNPSEFDGFRFARQEDGQRMYTVNTSLKNSTFGHGRHACPGRFFAINEIKLLMIELLSRYDVKLIPGTEPRRLFFGVTTIPETKLKLLLRTRRS